MPKTLRTLLLLTAGLLHGAATADVPHETETLFSALQSPWAIEVLPDGRYLVTERPGKLLLLDPEPRTRNTVHTFTDTVYRGQGGLMDIALHPEFDNTPDVFLTVVQRDPTTPQRVGVVLWRATLDGSQLKNLRIIYRQPDTAETQGHFGSRIVFNKHEGRWTLWLTLGEQQRETPAQDLSATAGKVIALTLDGEPAQSRSPIAGARPETLTMGHRNPQGIDVQPATGHIWVVEHGPQGGDELNRLTPGANYGWPQVSYGCPYGADPASACAIGGGQHAPRFVEPVTRWVPRSTAPSALRFYRGAEFPDLQRDALMTALAGRAVWRIRFNEAGQYVDRERIFDGVSTRLRDVATDKAGRILLLSEDGRLLRIRAASK